MNLCELQDVAILYDIDPASGITVTIHWVHLIAWHVVDCSTELRASLGLWIVVKVHLGSIDAFLTASAERSILIEIVFPKLSSWHYKMNAVDDYQSLIFELY